MIQRLVPSTLLGLPRNAKRGAVMLFDAAACGLTLWLAVSLRLEAWHAAQAAEWWAAGLSALLFLATMTAMGQYRVVHRFMGWSAVMALSRALVLYGIAFFVLLGLARWPGVPRTVGLIQPVLLALVVGASRFAVRYWLGQADWRPMGKASGAGRMLIYGAGAAGRQIARALLLSPDAVVVGYVDDDPSLQGRSVQGLTVFAPADLREACTSHGITDVLLAVPSASAQRRRALIESLLPLRLRVRTLPDLSALLHGRVSLSDVHDVQVDDLLGRAPVSPNAHLMEQNNRGRVVLVTGAGGSIGSELCRQILRCAPTTLLLLEASEYALYAVHRQLEALQSDCTGVTAATQLVPLLGSVCDEPRVNDIVVTWRPQAVYHAAAYKHVPLVEHNAAQGLANNVIGTLAVARVVCAHRVPLLVLISTDKAVRPTNVMGASKRLAEMVLQALAPLHPATTLCMVRFGNVLNSSGSVVPLFKQQIREGGPVTVTHPEITRFFMTITEASQLVIQAGAMAASGDVFVLDMGEPIKIADLARRMIELSGHSVRDAQHPSGSMAIAYTGLRPGEKLYEELLIGHNPQPTAHPRIRKAQEDHLPWPALQQHLAALQQALAVNDVAAMRATLQRVVSGYQPSTGIVDWVYTAHQPGNASAGGISEAAPAGDR